MEGSGGRKMYFMIPNSEVGCYQGRFLSVPVPLVFSTGSDLDTKKTPYIPEIFKNILSGKLQ